MKNRNIDIRLVYIESALSYAEYDKFEDGTFSGRIALCRGVIAFGKTLKECEDELQSTLEDWILVGLKLGHHIPIIEGYDLNDLNKSWSVPILLRGLFKVSLIRSHTVRDVREWIYRWWCQVPSDYRHTFEQLGLFLGPVFHRLKGRTVAQCFLRDVLIVDLNVAFDGIGQVLGGVEGGGG